MKNVFFYTVTVLIWGTTWLAIKFQLGTVDPMVSVGYRFALAGLILMIYCKIAGLEMRFTPRDHFFVLLQGLFLFAVNYLLFYVAEEVITSALPAVVFSTIVFMNIINGAIFLRSRIELKVVSGAVVGLAGISLVFWPEVSSFDISNEGLYGLLLSVAATYSASLGNIVSVYNQKRSLPVLQTNAFGMTYGAAIMFGLCLITGKTFDFSLTAAYVGSLVYLAVFGSVVAFGCYLTLVGRIGADRAAYSTLLFPLVALAISTIFEGYQWTGYSAAGVCLILFGNLTIINKNWRGWRPVRAAAKTATKMSVSGISGSDR